MKKQKITHNYKCQKCGKSATVNLQNNWHLWNITPKGNFEDNKEWSAGESNFWCQECYEKEAQLKSSRFLNNRL